MRLPLRSILNRALVHIRVFALHGSSAGIPRIAC
jgi:hypothetical protein